MASDNPGEAAQETAPRRTPSGPPPDYSETVGIVHLVEMQMQTHKAIGELTGDIRSINEKLNEQGKKIDSTERVTNGIRTTLYVIGVVLVIVFTIVGFILDAFWDDIRELLMTHLAGK